MTKLLAHKKLWEAATLGAFDKAYSYLYTDTQITTDAEFYIMNAQGHVEDTLLECREMYAMFFALYFADEAMTFSSELTNYMPELIKV